MKLKGWRWTCGRTVSSFLTRDGLTSSLKRSYRRILLKRKNSIRLDTQISSRLSRDTVSSSHSDSACTTWGLLCSFPQNPLGSDVNSDPRCGSRTAVEKLFHSECCILFASISLAVLKRFPAAILEKHSLFYCETWRAMDGLHDRAWGALAPLTHSGVWTKLLVAPKGLLMWKPFFFQHVSASL